MVSDEAVIAGIAAVLGLVLFSGSGSRVVDASPAPDAVTGVDPVVNPVNAVTEGSVWQGPDPLNLKPNEQGRGDLIAPVNPSNLLMSGPVWTGPDPLGLGGNN
jgi:hypothetical protein